MNGGSGLFTTEQTFWTLIETQSFLRAGSSEAACAAHASLPLFPLSRSPDSHHISGAEGSGLKGASPSPFKAERETDEGRGPIPLTSATRVHSIRPSPHSTISLPGSFKFSRRKLVLVKRRGACHTPTIFRVNFSLCFRSFTIDLQDLTDSQAGRFWSSLQSEHH